MSNTKPNLCAIMSGMSDNLSAWLANKLNQYDWSIRELGRRIGVSHTYAARIVNGESTPSIETCKKIANAFDVPYEQIYVLAGHMKPTPDFEEDILLKRAMIKFDNLSPDDQERVLLMMEALEEAQRREKRGRNNFGILDPRPSET